MDETRKLYTEEVKIKAKQRMLKYRYNLTEEQYNSLYEDQGGKCAICEEPYILGSTRGLYVDHCHSTNRVRGLLCPSCNSAIGKLRESPHIIKRALEYCSQFSLVHET